MHSRWLLGCFGRPGPKSACPYSEECAQPAQTCVSSEASTHEPAGSTGKPWPAQHPGGSSLDEQGPTIAQEQPARRDDSGRLLQLMLQHADQGVLVLDAAQLDEVLFQNSWSEFYTEQACKMHSTNEPCEACPLTSQNSSVLERLFCLDPCALESLQQAIRNKQTWSGLVNMPRPAPVFHSKASLHESCHQAPQKPSAGQVFLPGDFSTSCFQARGLHNTNMQGTQASPGVETRPSGQGTTAQLTRVMSLESELLHSSNSKTVRTQLTSDTGRSGLSHAKRSASYQHLSSAFLQQEQALPGLQRALQAAHVLDSSRCMSSSFTSTSHAAAGLGQGRVGAHSLKLHGMLREQSRFLPAQRGLITMQRSQSEGMHLPLTAGTEPAQTCLLPIPFHLDSGVQPQQQSLCAAADAALHAMDRCTKQAAGASGVQPPTGSPCSLQKPARSSLHLAMMARPSSISISSSGSGVCLDGEERQAHSSEEAELAEQGAVQADASRRGSLEPSQSFEDENASCWHHINARLVWDPALQKELMVLVQFDVSYYVNKDLQVKAILDLDHCLLEQVFPQHVLQAITSAHGQHRKEYAAEQRRQGHEAAAIPTYTQSASASQMSKLQQVLDECHAQLQQPQPIAAAARRSSSGLPGSSSTPTSTCLPLPLIAATTAASMAGPPSTAAAAAAATGGRCSMSGRLSLPSGSTFLLGSDSTPWSSLMPNDSEPAHPRTTYPAAYNGPTPHLQSTLLPHCPLPRCLSQQCLTALPRVMPFKRSLSYSGILSLMQLQQHEQQLQQQHEQLRQQLKEQQQQPKQEVQAESEARWSSPGLRFQASAPTMSATNCLSSPGVSTHPSICMHTPAHATGHSRHQRGQGASCTETGTAAQQAHFHGLQSQEPSMRHSMPGGPLSRPRPQLPPGTLPHCIPEGTVPNPAALASGLGCYHSEVTVMFADVVAFTSMSTLVKPTEVMAFLNALFLRFDSLLDTVEKYGVYKVETIGDCYMVCGGLLKRDEPRGSHTLWHNNEGGVNPACHMHTLAVNMLRVAQTIPMPATGGPVQLRIGMHTGPCVSGIVGIKMPRFCLMGDTVNRAARLEATCPHNCIQVSDSTWQALGSPEADPAWSPSEIYAKGIGTLRTMVWCDATHAGLTSGEDVHNKQGELQQKLPRFF